MEKKVIDIKNISRFKVEKGIIIPLILFAIISVVTVYSAQTLYTTAVDNFWLKQLIWYIIGFGIAYIVMLVGNKFLYQNAWIFYIIGVILLILVLFFGKEVNNSTCWFEIKSIGSFQPSEFMKIVLIIVLGRMIQDYNERYTSPSINTEFKFMLKVLIVVFIPTALTFVEPDTGAVIIYLIITFVMLFIGGIRIRWFVLTFAVLFLVIGGIMTTFYYNQELFIKILGTNFFYRIERILNWTSGSGMQLTNALTAISSGGMFGHGFTNTPIYFPEPQTDFIFAVFASNFGLIGAGLLIMLILFFDIRLVNTISKTNDMISKYVIGGILAMLFYQQVQNISMTIGLLPITGITLPFISYGGSSLVSYMIMMGVVFNISNDNLRYTN